MLVAWGMCWTAGAIHSTTRGYDPGSALPQPEINAANVAAAPDFVSRMEMEQLADLRPREREEEIASTKNRCLGFLSNPVVECVLGSPGQVVSFRDLIQQRGILIVDLSRGGVCPATDDTAPIRGRRQ